MPVIYNSSSPYFDTNQKNDIVSYLDFLTFREIPEDDTDLAFIVDREFHQRPDLLSHDLYGTPNLWWIFIVRNPNQMFDPIYDLVAGLEIYAPTKERIFNILGL